MPDGYPGDIPIAADAEFTPGWGDRSPDPSGISKGVLIAYKSKQSLEALYYLYVDFLKEAKDFSARKQDDGLPYDVYGIKDGFAIEVIIAVSSGNRVSIYILPEEDLH